MSTDAPLSELSAKATPGLWKADPKRLVIHNMGQRMEGPMMSYLAGNAGTGDGLTVSLGSERLADHHFVAALVNAYRAGELVERRSEKQALTLDELAELFSAIESSAVMIRPTLWAKVEALAGSGAPSPNRSEHG